MSPTIFSEWKPCWTQKGNTWRSQIPLWAMRPITFSEGKPCWTQKSNTWRSEKLLNTKGQYMKESNTLAGNAIIKQLQRKVLPNTKGQYIKESNTLAGNVENNLPGSQISIFTKWKDIENKKPNKDKGLVNKRKTESHSLITIEKKGFRSLDSFFVLNWSPCFKTYKLQHHVPTQAL